VGAFLITNFSSVEGPALPGLGVGSHPTVGFLVWRFCRVGLVVLGVAVLARAQASPAPGAGPGSAVALLPACAQIAAAAPLFARLAQACQDALSPDRLPDFVCDEKVNEFTRLLGDGKWMTMPDDVKWTKVGVITEQVTFEQGKGTQYANVAINGRPIRKLADWHSFLDYWNYMSRHDLGGLVDLGDFGTDLRIVFTPQNHTSFEYRNEITVRNTPLIVFGFQIKKQNTKSSNFMPGFIDGQITGGMGLLWLDKNTLSPRRIVFHLTEIDPDFPVYAAAIATDYGSVTIPNVGQFQLPTGGEILECGKSGECWRTIVTFNNCHKFAGKSRIVP
jgi:hypothetical protein